VIIGANALELIGNTPLVKINRLNPYKKVNIYAKIEGLNPSGSIKDRIALKMIEQAEQNGELTKDKTIIEATSGNTGIGIAMVAAIKGYKVQIVMSEAVSVERRKTLKAYGADVILTDADKGTDGAIRKAEQLVKNNPEKYFMPDQFKNKYNVLAHYENTAKEIFNQMPDIDVFIVIDDTDVKKMTRTELRDKLRAIIIGMGIEAGEMTGIKNKLSVQVYILTDFWESIRESNPVIFTFLRDGVPFYDRGIFMPWKQLLRMGKIRPSQEAIDMFMSTGEQTLERVKMKLKNIATEDFFMGIHYPTQAALMLYGVPPPAPKETAGLVRDILVKKEGLLEEEYVEILDRIIKIYKDMEHGKIPDFTGKDVDKLLADSEKYMKRLKRLFTQIEKIKEDENMIKIYDGMQTILRDVLKLEGIEKMPEGEIVEIFENKLIATGKVPAKFLRSLNNLVKAKEDYDAGKLTKTDIDKTRKESNELIGFLIDYMNRKKAQELARAKIRIKHGEKFAEITMLGKTAFIINNIEENRMEKATVNEDGSLGSTSICKPEEYEQALTKLVPTRITLNEQLFISLKKLFGDYEIIV